MNSLEPKRVIVIDDEEALRHAVKRILEIEGFIVKVAVNGTEGIKLATEEDYDLAIIDLKMPDINGIDVLKEIRKSKPNTICYIATAFASYDSAIESTKLGADGYILKPFTPEELISQLYKGIEKRNILLETERLRKEREESLLEVAFERTRLKTIINSLKDGVVVINIHGEAVYFNTAALMLMNLEYLPLGIPVVEHFPNEIASLLNSHFLNGENQENTFSAEINRNGEGKLFIEATLSPIKQQNNTLAGVAVILRNITEYKRLELAKSQFVSMVAHELKAPIAATIGFLEILNNPEMKIDDAQRFDFQTRSHSRLKSLLSMVNDLLDISRLEMNKSIREIRELPLNEIISEALLLCQSDIKKKNLKVKTNYSPHGITVKADLHEVSRLFLNLINNAVKYNKDGGSISVTAEEKNQFTVVKVSDTGIGLKPEEQAKLFVEYFRAKNEFTKQIHGTGLGLSIVKRIIESYDGKIEFKSIYGEGTEFILYFPAVVIGGQ